MMLYVGPYELNNFKVGDLIKAHESHAESLGGEQFARVTEIGKYNLWAKFHGQDRTRLCGPGMVQDILERGV